MSTTKKKIIIFSGIILVLLGLFLGDKISTRRTIVKVGKSKINTIEDFSITSRSIISYDRNRIYFMKKDGVVFNSIDRNADTERIFLRDNFAFIFEIETKTLTQYDTVGEIVRQIPIPGELFNIEIQNKNIIIHLKDGERESIHFLNANDNLVKIYETSNNILAFKVDEPNKGYIVTELTTDVSGYKTSIIIKDGEIKKYDILSEVGFFIGRTKNAVFICSDKSLYRIDSEAMTHVKIPNIDDVLMDGRSIHLLHGGILSTYDLELNEKNKIVVAANVERLSKVAGSIYAFGNTDVAGEIGTSTEYYTRLPGGNDEIKLGGLTVGTLKKGVIHIYKIEKTRSMATEGHVKDLTKEDEVESTGNSK